MTDDTKVISTDAARSGRTPHIVRYVLIISLALAVVAMGWTLLAAPKTPPAAPATAEAS